MEDTVAEGGKGGWVASLGEGGAAGIDGEGAVGGMAEALQVGVAMDDGIVMPLWQVVGVVPVAVCEEIASAIVGEDGVVAHDVEAEHHLVDLGVAVPAHGHDVLGVVVEEFGHALGVHPAGYAVARPVIEEVAEQNELVHLSGVVEPEDFLQRAGGAVEV